MTWAHMMGVGRETTACQRDQSVLMSAMTPLLLNVRSQKLSATWDPPMAAGMATTVLLLEQSALQSAMTPCPPSVRRESLLATWDITMVAGLEISAMRTRMDSSVPQFATGQLTLSVRMARFSATWVLMQIIAGWETTVCQPDPNVQPLQEFNQIPDVSI